jgi:syntaxin 7
MENDVRAQASMVQEFQKHLRRIKDLLSVIGTARETKQTHNELTQERKVTNSLTKDIANSFKVRSKDRVLKAQQDKLAKEFELLLKQYQDLTKQILDTEREVTSIIQETLANEEFKRSGTISQTGPKRMQTTMHLVEIGAFDEVVLRERQNELESLESDIVAVNSMFKDVARMVNEQGEQLDKVEEHVDTAVSETGIAVKELGKVRTR